MTDLHRLVHGGEAELMIAYDLDIARDIVLTPLRATRPYVLLPPDHRFADRDDVDAPPARGRAVRPARSSPAGEVLPRAVRVGRHHAER